MDSFNLQINWSYQRFLCCECRGDTPDGLGTVGPQCLSSALHGGTGCHDIIDEHDVFGHSGSVGRKGAGNIDATSMLVELSLWGGITGSPEAVAQGEWGAFGELSCDEGTLVEASGSKPRSAEGDWDDMSQWAREHIRAGAVDELSELGCHGALTVEL